MWQDENIADTIAAKAVQYIEAHKDSAFFLYVGTNDIHVPRYPHERFRGKSGMGYRGDAILQFDWTIGQITQALEENGIADNTLIILTSDNGPVVNDGYLDQAFELLGEHRPWGELRGGKYSNFEAGTRVPFIVHWPAGVEPAVSNALMSHIDLFSSLATLSGGTVEAGMAMDSQNQLDALLGKDNEGRDYVIESAQSISITDGEWKYIMPCKSTPYYAITRTETGNSKEEQLYNLQKDLGEQQNVAAENPEKVKELKVLLKKETDKGCVLNLKHL